MHKNALPSTYGNDEPHEACGVIGVYAPGEDVARTAFFGLFALQHRGQESAGIAASDGSGINVHTSMGLVAQAFREDDLESLKGHISIGHTRYSTMGAPRRNNAQPIISTGGDRELALAHNGNVINARPLREKLERQGARFSGTSDSEVISEMYARAPGDTWPERSAYCMTRLQGAYSLTMMTKDQLIGVRDPLGIRPLCLGRLNKGWVIASESCAIDHIGGTYEREIMPGETVVVDESGIHSSVWPGARSQHAMCIFEHTYFARPDSLLNGERAYENRLKMGAELAREHPADADMVVGIPDSSLAAAVGYARESGIPYGDALVKNRYVGRTFIEPSQSMRSVGVGMKFNTLPGQIEGKRIVVVDDSIVRGTTTPRVVDLLRQAGAREIHMRVATPPVKSTCHFGVDMGTLAELIAANHSIEEIREYIGADSLRFLSIEGLRRAVSAEPGAFCDGCFTGRYPIEVEPESDKMRFEALATAGARS
ncbi:MAG: amidophosphoribosyltransferase [Chloroflexota bacterium]